jgi:hypothetical protein
LKIVGLQELCASPSGTIFSAFDSNTVSGLYQFDSALDPMTDPELISYYHGVHADFFFYDLTPRATSRQRHGYPEEPVSNDNTEVYFAVGGGRWGNLEPDEQFIVYETEDIKKLVGYLTFDYSKIGPL